MAHTINPVRNRIKSSATLEVPAHWLSAICNGDETSFDLFSDPSDRDAYKRFIKDNIPATAVVDPDEDGCVFFSSYHDARDYGVLPCDCVDVLVTVFEA